MKEFIFDEYGMCINPNRIELGDKDFWMEIMTACNDGVWYSGFRYWQRGRSWEHHPYLNTNKYTSESEAICDEVRITTKFLKEQNESKYNDLEVPDRIFKQLRDLKTKCKTTQLSLF